MVWSSSVHVFDWPEPTAYLAAITKDVQETFLYIFYSIFMMKKCNFPPKRKEFIMRPHTFLGGHGPGIAQRDEWHARPAMPPAWGRAARSMLGGPKNRSG